MLEEAVGFPFFSLLIFILDALSVVCDGLHDAIQAAGPPFQKKHRIYQHNYHQMERIQLSERVKERNTKVSFRYRTNASEKVTAKQKRFATKGKISKNYYCIPSYSLAQRPGAFF